MGSLESDTTEQLHFHFSLSFIGEGNGNPLQCSFLENPRDGKAGGLPSTGSHRVGHDWSDTAAAAAVGFSGGWWRRWREVGSIPGLGSSRGKGNGNPLQDSCIEKSKGQRSLTGYSTWGHKESGMTEQLSNTVSSVTQLCPTLWGPMNCSTPGLPVHHQLQEFTQTHVHWVSDAIQPSNPLSSPSPPALNLSQHQGLFKCVSSSHQVAKVLEFQLQHQSFQWIPRTDLFRMDCLDLLAVQGTLKSLPQQHSSKASILQCSAFSIVQLSHPYMTTGKTIALTRQTFVGNAMSLIFNMLSRLVKTFLPRSKHLSISWLK